MHSFFKLLYSLALVFLSSIVYSSSAYAHIKWFIDEEEVFTKVPSQNFYTLFSPEVMLWIGIIILGVYIAYTLDKYIGQVKSLDYFAKKNSTTLVAIARVFLGIFLIAASSMWNVFLLPNIINKDPLISFLVIIQACIGLLFIVGKFIPQASIGLMALYLCTGLFKGPIPLLENLLLFALAVYFYLMYSSEKLSAVKIYKPYAVDIVRIGTGLSLIVLAFTEKLLFPQLSMAFLATHPWNFMQILGFSVFTDKLFILSVGMAEMFFGILFISGYITRIVTVAIAIFFATSVTTMLLSYSKWEVEDLVVYSAAVILLFFGNGKTKWFKKFH